MVNEVEYTSWALLAIDISDPKVYYGDSLGWSLPTNIADTVVPNLKKIEDNLDITNKISRVYNVLGRVRNCVGDLNAGGRVCAGYVSI